MASRRPVLRPVVVEVQPDAVPASPATPLKSVRFAPTHGSSRPLSTVEAWSVYNFELHARSCPTCYRPRVSRLCDTGYALSEDVACHIFSRDGHVYAVQKDGAGLVRVEIPHAYSQLRHLLRSTERALRKHTHTTVSAPTTTDYTRVYPISSTRRTYQPDMLIEPASSDQTRRRKHRSRYSTVVPSDGRETLSVTPMPIASTERRGTLYEREAQRRKENARIEVREPEVNDLERRYRRHSIWL
ncbi:hypothetical protein CERZMDRAFT_47627 [Cercospora zeae-maydis SCOH1-5]|uniref:Uncharacterized protein n=1 Tax=Cercospora zeae-maydis SCOH1-5 TaxID=717836 RepID=A0A6A6F7N5_9PEZI|nr:hypothetical protein CERZMDRAFT_47627 [Cercospora zeae-maydis SCOH1-5]